MSRYWSYWSFARAAGMDGSGGEKGAFARARARFTTVEAAKGWSAAKRGSAQVPAGQATSASAASRAGPRAARPPRRAVLEPDLDSRMVWFPGGGAGRCGRPPRSLADAPQACAHRRRAVVWTCLSSEEAGRGVRRVGSSREARLVRPRTADRTFATFVHFPGVGSGMAGPPSPSGKTPPRRACTAPSAGAVAASRGSRARARSVKPRPRERAFQGSGSPWREGSMPGGRVTANGLKRRVARRHPRGRPGRGQ